MTEILPISSLIPATRAVISSVIVNGGLYAFIAISQYHQPLSFQYAPAALPICSFTLYLTGLRHMLVSSFHRATADITFLCGILIRCSWSTAYDGLHSLPNSIIYSIITRIQDNRSYTYAQTIFLLKIL